MSSFIRRIERTIARSKNPDCKAPHYMGRGSKLGVKNPKDPCINPRWKKAPMPWRSKRALAAHQEIPNDR